jgi:hypothetical protein
LWRCSADRMASAIAGRFRFRWVSLSVCLIVSLSISLILSFDSVRRNDDDDDDDEYVKFPCRKPRFAAFQTRSTTWRTTQNVLSFECQGTPSRIVSDRVSIVCSTRCLVLTVDWQRKSTRTFRRPPHSTTPGDTSNFRSAVSFVLGACD